MDSSLVEEVLLFGVGEDGLLSEEDPKQYCVAVEQPNLTLAGVVAGMLNNEECQSDVTVRRRYIGKIFAVLRVVCKALRYLHDRDLVHGCMNPTKCGKYGGKWKLAGMLSLNRVGSFVDRGWICFSAPPESLELDGQGRPFFRDDYRAAATLDSWGFGKLAYEVLVGTPLFELDGGTISERGIMQVLRWSDSDVNRVGDDLRECYLPEEWIAILSCCLAPNPGNRLSMNEILDDPAWKELRRHLSRHRKGS